MTNNNYGVNERRNELLKTISGYLQNVGLLDFSFRGAAKAAEVSPMTLVRYFKNRDGLIDELLDYLLKEYIKNAEVLWPENFVYNPVNSLRKLVLDLDSAIYNVDNLKIWYQLILLAESPNAPQVMHERLKKTFLISRDYIVSLMRTQGLNEDRALKVGVTLHSFSNGIYRDFLIHKNKETTRDSFEMMVNWLEAELKKQF